jgi:hypothetical protein
MKNLLVMAVATLFATNALAAEMKWNGSAGWRYSQATLDDSLGSLDSTANAQDVSKLKQRNHQMRANLGVTGGWEHVEYGIGVRTTGAANGDYTTVNQNSDKTLGFDQAWFRYVRDFGSMDLGVTIGRQKNALITDNQWETLFSNDVRWDGFGWNFKFGMFGLNASQYVLGKVSRTAGSPVTTGSTGASTYTYSDSTDTNAVGNQHFAMVYAFQPHMSWKFSDEIEAMFSVAYYKWVYEGATNQIGGGMFGNYTGNTGTIPAIVGRTYKMDNNTQWDFLATIALPFNLNFTGDYVKANKATYNDINVAGYTGSSVDVGSAAWTLGLTYGKLRKAQDFTIGYAYTTKGVGSEINNFANDHFAADNKGHTVILGYSMADNFNLGLRWMSLQEKELISTRGTATAGGNAGSTYNQNLAGTAGVNSSQKMKSNYWELTAGVAF